VNVVLDTRSCFWETMSSRSDVVPGGCWHIGEETQAVKGNTLWGMRRIVQGKDTLGGCAMKNGGKKKGSGRGRRGEGEKLRERALETAKEGVSSKLSKGAERVPRKIGG